MTALSSTPADAAPARDERRGGLALLVIATAQLMVVLDSTITNIALPSIQSAFDITGSTLAWIVNSYALAFGGFLLLGGRAGDLYGRRRMFRLGLAVFVVASLLGGLAPNVQLLIGARVIQGLGAAIVAPTALSLISTNFAEGEERGKAMGVYAAMSGIGAAIGLLLGGSLTDYLSWRWVFFVNVPIGVAALAGSKLLAEWQGRAGRLDVPGAVTGTVGLVTLAYGITRAGDHGWGDGITLLAFAVAAVLLAAFLAMQARRDHPMLPLHLLRDRDRSGAYATMLFVGASTFAMFYFLTLYMQQVLSYSPVKTGLAFLTFSAGIMVSAAALGPQLIARFGLRAMILGGTLVSAIGMLWFSLLDPDSSYATGLLPGLAVTSLGVGATILSLTLAAVAGTTDEDAGIASGLLNSAQQIGGALGLAVLSTVATAAANSRLPEALQTYYRGLATHDAALVRQATSAMTHGYTSGFVVGSALLAAGLVVAVLTITARHAPADATGAPGAPGAPGEVASAAPA